MSDNTRFRQIRKALNFSQEDFADKLDVNASSIRNYEAGRQKPEKLASKLSELFNVNPTWFLTGQGEMFLSDAGPSSGNPVAAREDVSKYGPDLTGMPDRIRKARLALGYNQEQAAKEAGCNRITYSRYETGASSPTKSYISNLARALMVSVEWLQFGTGNGPEEGIQSATVVSLSKLPIIHLPLLTYHAAASFKEGFFEEGQRWEGETYSVIRQPQFNYSNAVVITIEGSSMEPRYPAGSKVVATPVPSDQWPYIHGTHAVSLKNSMFLLKRIVANDGNSITIRSDNSPVPDDRTIPISEINFVWKPLHIAFAPAE